MIELTGMLCFFLGAILGCMMINFIVTKFYKGKMSYCISFVIICLICGFTMSNGNYFSGVFKGAYSYIIPMIIFYFFDKKKKKAK